MDEAPAAADVAAANEAAAAATVAAATEATEATAQRERTLLLDKALNKLLAEGRAKGLEPIVMYPCDEDGRLDRAAPLVECEAKKLVPGVGVSGDNAESSSSDSDSCRSGMGTSSGENAFTSDEEDECKKAQKKRRASKKATKNSPDMSITIYASSAVSNCPAPCCSKHPIVLSGEELFAVRRFERHGRLLGPHVPILRLIVAKLDRDAQRIFSVVQVPRYPSLEELTRLQRSPELSLPLSDWLGWHLVNHEADHVQVESPNGISPAPSHHLAPGLRRRETWDSELETIMRHLGEHCETLNELQNFYTIDMEAAAEMQTELECITAVCVPSYRRKLRAMLLEREQNPIELTDEEEISYQLLVTTIQNFDPDFNDLLSRSLQVVDAILSV